MVESIKNIINEFEPVAVLTPESFNNMLETGDYSPEVENYLNTYIEEDITQYFYYNDLELINGDLKVYLTSNYRSNNIFDILRIETIPEYNSLLYNLEGDIYYYLDIDPIYSHYTVEEEALDFLTYEILTEYLEGENKTTITSKDILLILSMQDQEHQEIIRKTDYKELFDDIIQAYNKLVSEILEEVEEEIQNKYYEELYYPAMEAAELQLLEELPKPLTEL